MTDQRFISKLTQWLHESADTVFFGGAGVSTESGVADFRSATGIYSQMGGAERYLTLEFMNSQPEEFYSFYRKFFMKAGIRPNPAHTKLAEMEAAGKLSAIVTQNVDGLHQAAGSRRVYELHGNGNRFYCQRCSRKYTFDEAASAAGAFYCRDNNCGGLVRPDIVMYGEPLDEEVIGGAVNAIAGADLLIVGGSSMTVYPAAGMIHYRKPGSRLVLINLEATPYDSTADLVAHESIGELFSSIELESR
ncbi:MAG TPA: NAD-dependent protein deacylase [Bacillota bacterium]|nr:NAD-dependent protein deacylase [Fastidiosipila sp.]HPX93852.1 NAD-dependent protein deacylase [Bacillota bacterium]HQB81717.1 NAD-dependent protein deacylase [Bacillota bacterium]